MILMTQKKIVTSGTLLSILRAVMRPAVALSVVRAVVVMVRDAGTGALNDS
jgi:hypothetical protein